MPAHEPANPAAALIETLPNGVRVVALPMPHLHTASVSVFVRVGSAHESHALNGIGHVLEHMAFKGTRERDAHRVNLDAERLGAEVNAHTDKDHTAYHMRGLGAHAPQLVAMLADIVRHATFPDDELAREREVLLQEVAEVEDDPMTIAYQQFDQACWGSHPAAQPVIGQRRVIERCTRAQLIEHVHQSASRGVCRCAPCCTCNNAADTHTNRTDRPGSIATHHHNAPCRRTTVLDALYAVRTVCPGHLSC